MNPNPKNNGSRKPRTNTAARRGNPARDSSVPGGSDGLYSPHFHPDELAKIDILQASDLSAEISMLRVAIRRVFMAANVDSGGVENGDTSGHWMEVLSALGMASSRLAGLLRTQHKLREDGSDDVSAALSQALAELTKEMNLDG